MLESLVDEVGKFSSAYKGKWEEIRSISNFFNKEDKESERIIMLFNEIMQLEGAITCWDTWCRKIYLQKCK